MPLNFARCALALGLVLVLAACSSSTGSVPQNAGTGVGHPGKQIAETVYTNHSDRCAWVTVYWAYGLSPWEIADDADNSPRLVRPNDDWHFRVDYNNPTGQPVKQMKIQSEMFSNATCSGGGPTQTAIDDSLDQNCIDYYDVIKVRSELTGSGGNYNTSISSASC
jgi:hypothetical protein